MNRPVWILMAAATIVFFTSSFDIFLSVDLGPNLRIAQLFSLVLIVAALITRRLGLEMEMPLGATWLLVWCCVQIVFVPVAEFWQKSMAYCVWLGVDIALLFAMVNLFARDPARVRVLLKLYLASFVFVACFGIVQFVLPIIGGPALLVEQWWLPGRVPRVNGFSFEPSYYATYLIMGLACLGSLRRSRITEFRARRWTVAYLLLVVAMVLCSSRLGIAFVVVELAIEPVRRLWRIVRRPSLVLGFRVSAWKILLALAGIWAAQIGVEKGNRLVSLRSGHDKDSCHRHGPSWNGFALRGRAAGPLSGDTANHRGPSMDGAQSGRSDRGHCQLRGKRLQNFEESKRFEGQSVLAEVVAASGLPGSIPFFCFLIAYVAAPLRLARISSPFDAAWLRALVLSLVFEWAILEFNQNILRLYLWVHIAVLAMVFAAVRRQYGESGELGSLVAGYEPPNLLA